jgi:hypothetical protein
VLAAFEHGFIQRFAVVSGFAVVQGFAIVHSHASSQVEEISAVGIITRTRER